MQQKLSFFTIGVNDLPAMTAFYQDVFGWKALKDSDGVTFFKLNGFIFGLYPADELAEDVGVQQDGSGFKRVTMAVNFASEAEVDQQFANLTAKGARGIKSPEKVFWGGYRGYIADPENNYWELAHNPFLTMDEAGNVLGHL